MIKEDTHGEAFSPLNYYYVITSINANSIDVYLYGFWILDFLLEGCVGLMSKNILIHAA